MTSVPPPRGRVAGAEAAVQILGILCGRWPNPGLGPDDLGIGLVGGQRRGALDRNQWISRRAVLPEVSTLTTSRRERLSSG